MNISGFQILRNLFGIPSYNGANLLDVNGNIISGIASHTWAQFTDAGFDLTTARYVRVTDEHSSRNNEGGSLWYVDPTATNKRVLYSDPIYASTRANALSAVTYPGLRQFIANEGAAGIDYISDGTDHVPTGGAAVLRRGGAQSVIAIQPAATFTSVTPSQVGADTLLTSAGVHGLTAAVAEGASIYISGGTGWTVGWHTITDIAVDTTGVTIQIDTPFDAGFGTPTISLTGTELVLDTVAVPPLTPNSELDIDITFGYTNSATAKAPKIQLNTTTFYAPTVTTTDTLRPSSVKIRNRNSRASQVGAMPSSNTAQNSTSSAAVTTGAVDTSVATTLKITCQPAAANNRVWFEGLTVVWRA